MIKQSYKYMGNPYLVGSSTSPNYGTDCSGLMMQALYAGGINPAPISSIHHAYSANEWPPGISGPARSSNTSLIGIKSVVIWSSIIN